MKALRFLLMAGCVLGLELGSALGQGIESCSQCICVYDNTCSTTFPCVQTASFDCRSHTFTAACGGGFKLRALLNCGSGTYQCKYCFSCAKLYDNNTSSLVAICHNGCESDACDDTCDVDLTYGHEYTLEVCLRQCEENGCEECGCTAFGYVFRNPSDCNTIPPCH